MGGVAAMPFGKFRGTPLDELPDDYIEWLTKLDLRDPLLSDVRRERERRKSNGQTDSSPAPVDAAVAEEIIASGLRALATKHQPSTMGRFNAAADQLRKLIQRGAS